MVRLGLFCGDLNAADMRRIYVARFLVGVVAFFWLAFFSRLSNL